MKREFTSKVRYVLDECIPPMLRDSRWFMWPFFVLAYGTFSVGRFMDFKAHAYSMTDEEYQRFYSSLGNSISRNRVTDLNQASLQFIAEHMAPSEGLSLLDVGMGNGYLLNSLRRGRTWHRVAGVDVTKTPEQPRDIEFHVGMLPSLPFKDKEFDVVTCTHVIEHLLDVEKSIQELLRVTKRQLFIVLPRQRYYFYTLDEHLNFYPRIEPLLRMVAPFHATYMLRDGDWNILVDLTREG